jgi:MFS transporter, FSR family, fosmidomycin resistance protein
MLCPFCAERAWEIGRVFMVQAVDGPGPAGLGPLDATSGAGDPLPNATGRVWGPPLRVQWMQLVVLSMVHFLVDMFGNVLPALLPVICDDFRITLALGGFVLVSLPLASNGIQILTGHLRPNKTRPLFLYVGVVLAASICLMALAPRSLAGVAFLVVLGVISGSGVAIAHPEGLRAVHTLDRIAPSLSTAVFMTAGFLGFASGGAVSAGLVASYGLKGLYPLIPLLLLGVVTVRLSRVRLAVESDAANGNGHAAAPAAEVLPFWKVMAIGLPAAISTTILQSLIPTYLHELGFDLAHGGVAVAVFGWGGVVGPFLWTVIARRKGDLPACTWAFLLAGPFIVLYLILAEHAAAVWLLFGVGFSATSAYVLTVTVARQSRGSNLGRRMALIVGGTWGCGTIALMIVAPLADWVGTGAILRLTPAGYILSGLCTFYVWRQHPQAARARAAAVIELPGKERASA